MEIHSVLQVASNVMDLNYEFNVQWKIHGYVHNAIKCKPIIYLQ